MTRRELVSGVFPTRLVCPWWARGVDSSCQGEGGSGFEAFVKLSKEKSEQEGTAEKDGVERSEALVEVQPFMKRVEARKKSVVLKPRDC